MSNKEKMLFWIQRNMTRRPEAFANDQLWRGYLIALNDMRKKLTCDEEYLGEYHTQDEARRMIEQAQFK